MKEIFIGVVVGALIIDFALIFTPITWVHLYDREVLDALSWNGYKSKFGDGPLLRYLLFAAYGVVSIGLIFFKRWARPSFVVITIVTIGLSPLWGISIQYGYESALNILLGLLDGAILAMLFFTNIGNKFERTS